MPAFMKRSLAAPLAALFLVIVTQLPALAFQIQEVTSPQGLKAWLVEDYTVPIVTVAVAFQGGSVQDPEGKEGLADLISTLFDEGAGDLDSRAFQARLERLGVDLAYSDSRDQFTGTMRTLKEDSADAFEMMRLSLTQLRFEESAIARMRQALKSRIAGDANDASQKATTALRRSLFAEHPYSRPSRGTAASLDAITRDDIVAQFAKLFARDNLTVAVVGAFSPQETAAMLDKVFGGLPQKAQLAEVSPARLTFGERIEQEDSGTQAEISLALPGVKRDSPNFFAAYLMNEILGGGSFTSRLYEEVREKRGLAYSIGSSLASFDKAAYLSISTATRADRAEETLALIRSEIKRLATQGPTAEELEATKKYVIGAYAINNLDTSGKIAEVLLTLQTQGLGIDYIQRRAALINAVTLDEVKAIAAELLSVEPTVVIVGPGRS
ncbi:MAG: insulinase family protein [Nitratireductor sp.]|nr:insulinase family protein [Nitratireductor sp.]